MHRMPSTPLLVMTALILASVVQCGPEPASGDLLVTVSSSDEKRVVGSLPRPDDADPVQVSEGLGWGFTTSLIEPELFDFYTESLEERGWRRQAPTEAVVAPPHQVWRKNQYRLLIEIQGIDEHGRTIVWLQLEDMGRAQ